MTDLEQQMKAALDGHFWYFWHDGSVKCKDVDENFSGASSFNNNYCKDYMAKGGNTSAKVRLQHFRRPAFKFTTGQIQWLKKNFREKSIKYCAERLGITYDQCYQKVTALRREDRVGKL